MITEGVSGGDAGGVAEAGGFAGSGEDDGAVEVTGAGSVVETAFGPKSLTGEATQISFPFIWGLYFFLDTSVQPSSVLVDWNFRLDWSRFLASCSLCRLLAADGGRGDCGVSGCCSILLGLLRAKLCDVSQLLTAPTSQASSFHDHHHPPLSVTIISGMSWKPSRIRHNRNM